MVSVTLRNFTAPTPFENGLTITDSPMSIDSLRYRLYTAFTSTYH